VHRLALTTFQRSDGAQSNVLLLGLPEKHTGQDDVAKPLCPNVHVFPFLPQVAFARKFMANVHRAIPARSQHWKIVQLLNNFHFALAAHGDNWVVLRSKQLSHHSI